MDESEEPLEASDSSAAGSDDWGSADENPLDKSDDEQREPASIDSVPAATAEKPEGDKQSTHPILIGMASDGASVLSGKKGGVQAILTKEVNSHMVYIWCISHCLQLSLKDALKKGYKEFKDLNDFLLQLYPFHIYSNVVHSAFENAVKLRNRKGGTTVIRVDGTRWVFHMTTALKNVLNTVDCHQDCLAALRNASNFSNAQKVKAKYFEKRLRLTAFIEFMIFLLDILIGLSRSSLFSQSRNVPFAAVQLSMESCVDRLELLKNGTGRGTEWQKYENGDAIGQDLSCNWPNYKKVLDQCQLSAGQEHLSEETKLKVLDIVIQCIKQRCSELEKLSPLLNITSLSKNRLFSLDSVSTNGIRKWKATEWMATELSKLKEQPFVNKQFVKQGIVVEEILVEWRALQRKLPSLDLDWEHPENLSWENVISQVSADDFFNFISLIDFLGTFISSAEAERGFSQLKVTKTDKRSQLQ